MIYVLFLLLASCASQDHKRELLQKQNPDCFVMPDLQMECPDPFEGLFVEPKRVTKKTVTKKGKK